MAANMFPLELCRPFNLAIDLVIEYGIDIPWLPDHPRKPSQIMTADQFDTWIRKMAWAFSVGSLSLGSVYWDDDQLVREWLIEKEFEYPSVGLKHWKQIIDQYEGIPFYLNTTPVLIPYPTRIVYSIDPLTFISKPPAPSDTDFQEWKAQMEGILHAIPIAVSKSHSDFRIIVG